MWDVAHPTKNGADEMGREWDGWNEEKLRLFEVLNPRPGAFRCVCSRLASSCGLC